MALSVQKFTSEQIDVLKYLLNKNDVFLLLMTGGKK
jgi:hypothetical protein